MTNLVDSLALMEAARLRGTWPQLQAFREQERRRLREEGKSKTEAREESWRLAEQAYPPSLGEYFASFDRPPSLPRSSKYRVY